MRQSRPWHWKWVLCLPLVSRQTFQPQLFLKCLQSYMQYSEVHLNGGKEEEEEEGRGRKEKEGRERGGGRGRGRRRKEKKRKEKVKVSVVPFED